MFMRVRAEVMKQTGSKQVPWEASSLVGSLFQCIRQLGAEDRRRESVPEHEI